MRDPGRAARTSPPLPGAQAPLRGADEVVAALRSCSTEADIVQVLYQAMHPRFGYEVVGLFVLESDSWYHAVAVDQGILQDLTRRSLADSRWREYYGAEGPSVVYPSGAATASSRGPGAHLTPRTVIFVPCRSGDTPVGAVLYQSYADREVPPEEIAFIEAAHRDLGVLVSNAYLNELTRNQAVRLSALNETVRALALTQDEMSVTIALGEALRRMLPVDEVRLILLDDDPAYFRRLRHGGRRPSSARVPRRSRRESVAAEVIESGRASLAGDSEGRFAAGAWVPIREGGDVRGALGILSEREDAYEESTLTFLEQVADEASLALRNVASFAALEAQRRRLEVANAVGRRLASSLDRVSIMRTLREELERHLEFDGFALATISVQPDGPVAEGYQHMHGSGEAVYTVPLAAAGPSREAYETGRPVLVRRSPWARDIERRDAGHGVVHGEGAVFYVPDAPPEGRLAMRSIVWVPVRHGDAIAALLSLQSYRANAFGRWHVQLLEDVAAHVSLALANADHFAAAQAERRRLEALHVLELAVAGAADERGIAQSVVAAARGYIRADAFLVVYLDPDGRLAGFAAQGEALSPVEPRRVEETHYFRRLQLAGRSLVERAGDVPGPTVRGGEGPAAMQVLWVPIEHDGRVVAALSAQRHTPEPFLPDDVALLESAAPVVGIALRTVRLHRANELALAHSLRVQEVAALAGHELAQVVASIAEQARDMLGAAGAACWMLTGGEKPSLTSVSGDPAAAGVLEWSALSSAQPGPHQLTGEHRGTGWSLLPLWVASRLVGAIGAVHGGGRPEEPAAAALDFARHAAIAIENARLVDALAGERRTLAVILQHSPVGMILEDPEGRVLYANDEVEELYGASAGEMAGRRLDDVLASAGATVERDPETGTLVARLQKRERTIEIRRVTVPGSAEHGAGTLSVHEDVTRERQAIEAKDLMLRAIGHEVRSPAAAMKTTLAGVIQWNRVMDQAQREALLTEAYEMSDRLLSLVEGQLIIAKLETRRFEPSPVPVVLAKAIEQVTQLLRHRYGERAERISVRLASDLPRAFCEATHLDQVLTNLIGNALEYTDAPVTLTAESTGERGEWLEVTVSDAGSGLPADRVSTLFRKTGAGQGRARGGLGLGLYLCSLVVEQSFGGHIWLESTGRRGTTFKFTVPALAGAPAAAAL